MKINRESLADCFRDILTDDLRPVDPVLVYNSTTGIFSIQSNLHHMNDDERVISEPLNINPNGLTEQIYDIDPDQIEDAINDLGDDWISEYVIGV